MIIIESHWKGIKVFNAYKVNLLKKLFLKKTVFLNIAEKLKQRTTLKIIIFNEITQTKTIMLLKAALIDVIQQFLTNNVRTKVVKTNNKNNKLF